MTERYSAWLAALAARDQAFFEVAALALVVVAAVTAIGALTPHIPRIINTPHGYNTYWHIAWVGIWLIAIYYAGLA